MAGAGAGVGAGVGVDEPPAGRVAPSTTVPQPQPLTAGIPHDATDVPQQETEVQQVSQQLEQLAQPQPHRQVRW